MSVTYDFLRPTRERPETKFGRMLFFIAILTQSIYLCSGNDKHITVLNYYPTSSISRQYQCYTPSGLSNFGLSYAMSFKISTEDDLSERYWTGRSSRRFVTQGSWNMGVYYCKITGEVVSKVQTTIIRRNPRIRPLHSKVSVTTNVGEDVSIGFEATFNLSETTLDWRKDGNLLYSNTSYTNITFTSVKVENSGVYEMYVHGERELRDHAFIKLIVRGCPSQKWSPPECNNDCEYCYNGGVCDYKTGKCVCPPGFMGPACTYGCGGNRFGWNCENICRRDNHPAACSQIQFCLPDPVGCSCVTGYKGIDCSEDCPFDRFGAGCSQICHCKHGKCNQYTGVCEDTEDQSCMYPWKGPNCQECETALYGEYCEQKCYKPCECHRITSRCMEGTCQPGTSWFEPDCSIGILNTSFSSANNGQTTESSCTVYADKEEDAQVVVLVTKDYMSDNITTVFSTTMVDEYIAVYTFSVISNSSWTYQCILYKGNVSAYSNIEPDISILPSYNGSLKILNATSSSVTIEWIEWNNNTDNGDGPVIGYFVYYQTSNANNWNKHYHENTFGIVTDLMWDTYYTFAVSAVRPGEGGEGPVGKMLLDGRTFCGKPSPVEAVNHDISTTNPQNVKVSWTKINVDSETLKCFNFTYVYNVYLSTSSDSGIGGLVYRGRNADVTIKNVTVNTEFVITVTVSNQDSESVGQQSTAITSDTLSVSDDTPIGVVVGVVTGIVLLIAIIITTIMIYKRRRERQHECEDKIRFNAGIISSTPSINNESIKNGYSEKQTSSSANDHDLLSHDSENCEIYYANVDYSQRILVSDLVLHVAKSRLTTLSHEYELLPTEQTNPWTTAAKNCHKTKNRFKNIIPYDHNRVMLDTVDGDPNTDYYNASYIHGYAHPKHYVASQGPNSYSVGDFWRMVCQLDIKVIIMLTNVIEGNKIKCEKYWPDVDERLFFNEINVFTTSEEIGQYFVTRNIDIWAKGTDTQTITQLHFTSWPDKSVPKSTSSLLHFVKAAKKARGNSSKPTVVHCSAGVGRTGTFIAIDAMLDMMKEEESVDVLSYVKDLRKDRVNMVQTLEQYVFIYDVLADAYLNDILNFPRSELPTRIQRLKRVNPATKKTFIEEEFEMLVSVTPMPSPESMSNGRHADSIKKNRFANVLPVNRTRVILCSEINNYINASYLDGFKQNSRFIATQMPLKNTVDDFWKLIYEQRVTVIVMLNDLDILEDQTCAQYWQEVGSTSTSGDLEIKFNSEEMRETDMFIRKISITTKKERSKALNVSQIQATNWPVGQDSPQDLKVLLQIYEIVDSLNVGANHPIVVHCLNGIGRTGVYCAITEVLDRMKHDDVIDVFQTVRRLRQNRPGLIENVEQYILCYELLGEYLQRFATYAN